MRNSFSFYTFNAIDDFNHEALGIEVNVSLSSARIIGTLKHIIEWRGKPNALRLHNGPEHISSDGSHDLPHDLAVGESPLSGAQPSSPDITDS